MLTPQFLKNPIFWAVIITLITLVGMAEVIRSSRNQIALLQTELAQVKVEFKQLSKDITQAKNEMVATQPELLNRLSDEFKTQIKKHSLEVLAVTKATIKAEFDAVVDGEGTEVTPGVYSYTDQTMDHIKVDATTDTPRFSYQIRPLTVTLDGVLNFDEKDGVTRFWAQPKVVGNPGVHVSTPELTFTPSEKFNAWVSSLRGKDVFIPIHPRYSVGALIGVEDISHLGAGTRRVYGVDFNIHLQSGLGAGIGVIGKTGFMRFSYSFGK